VLMTNHIHLLCSLSNKNSLARTMQSLGIRYTRYFNAA
jgi:putative transposase